MADPLDVIEVLIRDHRTLDQLLDRLDEERQSAELRRLFLEILGEITAHENAEQVVVYPALFATAAVDDEQTRSCLMEHEEVNALLREMCDLNPGGPGFEKRASALVLELRQHWLTEEECVFKVLRDTFTHEELVHMAAQARAAKRGAPPCPRTEGLVVAAREALGHASA